MTMINNRHDRGNLQTCKEKNKEWNLKERVIVNNHWQCKSVKVCSTSKNKGCE